MIKLDLPRGLKYRMEKVLPGRIIPGSDNEPIITIYGRDVCRQYRLTHFALIEETCKGDLSDDEILAIEDEIQNYLSSLLSIVNVRHYVQFDSRSRCYYDFVTGMLCEANGVRAKKGAINGIPFEPTPSEKYFIDVLTGTPNVRFDLFVTAEKAGIAEGSINETWSRFLKYDPSIRATFSKTRIQCIYTGNAQTWMVGDENEDAGVTLETIFKAVANRNVAAVHDRAGHRLDARLLDGIDPEFILCFLGLDAKLLDHKAVDAGRIVTKHYCDSAALNALLRRYSYTLEAVWNQVKESVAENLSFSLRASSYYEDTERIPLCEADLRGYSFQTQSVRWENSLNRICPSIKGVLQKTCVGADFFSYCDTEVKTNNAIDYIAALVLASFCYCQTESADEEMPQSKSLYRQKLQALIREKFRYSPPNDGGNRMFDPEQFRKGLQGLMQYQEQMYNNGNYAYAAELKIYIDQLVMSFKDNNSLLPPSTGRRL